MMDGVVDLRKARRADDSSYRPEGEISRDEMLDNISAY
jgi:hypothetical protein